MAVSANGRCPYDYPYDYPFRLVNVSLERQPFERDAPSHMGGVARRVVVPVQPVDRQKIGDPFHCRAARKASLRSQPTICAWVVPK